MLAPRGGCLVLCTQDGRLACLFGLALYHGLNILQSACTVHVHQGLLRFGYCNTHDAIVWHLAKLHGRIRNVTAPKIHHSRSEQYLKQLMLLQGNAAEHGSPELPI
jgi:hypothetical protein